MEKDERTTRVFGELLKELRVERNLTQDFLGSRSGLGRNYIALLERGVQAPSLHALLSISQGLNLRFWQLARLFEDRLNIAKQESED